MNRKFKHYQYAMAYAVQYQKELFAYARDRQKKNLPVSDQDYPNVVIHLSVTNPTMAPLLMIGGMGPLAGIQGFKKACSRFKNSRDIILYQICNTPCRTKAIEESIKSNDVLFFNKNMVVQALVNAIVKGQTFFTNDLLPVDVMVLCNTAHHFLKEVKTVLKKNHFPVYRKIKIQSLIDSAINKTIATSERDVLILSSNGTRQSKLYTKRLQQNSIKFHEPDEILQQHLGKTISRGMKGFENNYALHQGEKFFGIIKAQYPGINTLLAGCTEIPLIMNLLKQNGRHDTREFLTGIEVIDPVTEALEDTSYFQQKNCKSYKKYGNYRRLY
ncbi:MAG: aspartate/glutamate racemase family protein [Leptospirales bacterium]